MKRAEDIAEAIDTILKSESQTSPAGASQQFIAAETSAAANVSREVKEEPLSPKPVESEIVCDGDVCYRKEKKSEEVPETSESTDKGSLGEAPTTPEETEEQRQEKIKHALKLIEEKRIARVKEEQRLEKEREIQRRKEGQEVQKLKKWQDETEMKNLQDERKRVKLEEKAARQRVLDQIEQDKKERAQRFQMTQSSVESPTTEQPKTAPAPTTTPPNSTKIQFKLPNGDSEVVTFESTMLFADVHAYVKSDVLQGSNITDFTLATTFPRREFTTADFDKTLLDHNLVPSSVILVIISKGKTTSNKLTPSSVLPTKTDGSVFDMIGALFMGIFSPVFALFAYVGRIFSGNRNNVEVNEESDVGKRKRNEDILTPNDAAKRRNLNAFYQQPNEEEPSTSGAPSTGAYKRSNQSSNIHRLHQDSDSEDEDRKTWNGNSTQQM